jgi:hypothetical protein
MENNAPNASKNVAKPDPSVGCRRTVGATAELVGRRGVGRPPQVNRPQRR